jgi:hypothetical protein
VAATRRFVRQPTPERKENVSEETGVFASGKKKKADKL